MRRLFELLLGRLSNPFNCDHSYALDFKSRNSTMTLDTEFLALSSLIVSVFTNSWAYQIYSTCSYLVSVLSLLPELYLFDAKHFQLDWELAVHVASIGVGLQLVDLGLGALVTAAKLSL
jgi:hypothetical protein